MSLFKYCAPNLTSVISNGSIRFTPPHLFNDPFELKPHIAKVANDSEVDNMYELAVKHAIAVTYDGLPDSQKRFISREDFNSTLLDHLCTQKVGLENVHMRSLAELELRLNEEFKKCGILCLTQNPDSILMWAHYTDSHKGFVLEFDPDSEFFNYTDKPGSYLGRLLDVDYATKRPSIILGDLVDLSPFLTKSEDWAYEMEKRVLRPLTEASSVINPAGEDIHLFKFPKSAIRSVIIGCRMHPEKEDQIRAIISNDPEYSNVTIKKASIDQQHYRINIE